MLIPMRCQTADGRNVLIAMFTAQVREQLIKELQGRGISITAAGKNSPVLSVAHGGRLALVEIGAESVDGGFRVGVWVNGESSSAALVTDDVREALKVKARA